MKIRVKDTGKIIECADDRALLSITTEVDAFGNDQIFKFNEIEIVNNSNSNNIPSEQIMRYEISKEALNGILSYGNCIDNNFVKENTSLAIKYADEMINKLKETEETNEY